jgi:hypothetical protein
MKLDGSLSPFSVSIPLSDPLGEDDLSWTSKDIGSAQVGDLGGTILVGQESKGNAYSIGWNWNCGHSITAAGNLFIGNWMLLVDETNIKTAA